MNLYKSLLAALENNEGKVLITKLKGREGFIDKDLERILSGDYKEALKGLDKDANNALEEGKLGIIRDQTDSILYIEPFYPRERLIILGGGHIALPLVEFGTKIGFRVTVVDDRPFFANKPRFPLADKVICQGFDRIFDELKLTINDYIVVITRGHRHDMDCLRQILKRTETIYVGMIGSRRRVKGVLELLQEEGFDKGRLERICTPIGLSIGAVTPEEISISIVAQIISKKRQGTENKKVLSQTDVDYEVIELLAKREEEPMSIVTVIDTKGSVPRGIGAKMIVYPTGQIAGSIGGGCSEAAIIHDAISIIGSKKFMIQTIDMTGEVAESEGMVCGGIMEVLIEDNV